MEIRTFHDSDTNSVVALWNVVFAYSAPHNEPVSVIQHKLAVQDGLFFVALADNVLIGTVVAGYDGHRGWIYSIAVAPETRRQDVGSALMKHAERELDNRGCRKVNLQLLASNAGTAEFYRTLGYAVEERVRMGKLL